MSELRFARQMLLAALEQLDLIDAPLSAVHVQTAIDLLRPRVEIASMAPMTVNASTLPNSGNETPR